MRRDGPLHLVIPVAIRILREGAKDFGDTDIRNVKYDVVCRRPLPHCLDEGEGDRVNSPTSMSVRDEVGRHSASVEDPRASAQVAACGTACSSEHPRLEKIREWDFRMTWSPRSHGSMAMQTSGPGLRNPTCSIRSLRRWLPHSRETRSARSSASRREPSCWRVLWPESWVRASSRSANRVRYSLALSCRSLRARTTAVEPSSYYDKNGSSPAQTVCSWLTTGWRQEVRCRPRSILCGRLGHALWGSPSSSMALRGRMLPRCLGSIGSSARRHWDLELASRSIDLNSDESPDLLLATTRIPSR